MRSITACVMFGFVSAVAGASSARAVDCNTVDPPPSEGFSIQRYADMADADDVELQKSIEEFRISPYGTFFFADRWIRSDGLTPSTGKITLGVAFLGGTNEQRETVKSRAVQWLDSDIGKLIDFRFEVDARESQIRISFRPGGGNNSSVGRRALNVSKTSPTMNLQETTQRAIVHEFGHAIGLLHEHMHPESGIAWNEPVVISALHREFGWSEAYIRKNVLNRFSADAACVGDPSMNRKSIMIYRIPPEWTVNGYSTPLVQEISDRDRRCVLGIYKR